MRASVQPILPLYRPQDIPRETDAHFRKYQTVAGADRQVTVRSVGFGRGCSIPHSPKVNSYYWTRRFLGAGRTELAAPDIAASIALIFAPTSVPSEAALCNGLDALNL